MPVISYIFLCFLLLPQVLVSSAWGKNTATEGPVWKKLESKYTFIQYQSIEDLKRFNNQLDFGEAGWSLQHLFSTETPMNQMDGIRNKVDMIFTTVQQLLDMRKKMKKVTVNIYPNREQLDNAFFQLYQKNNHFRAGYIYELNTIYVNVKDLHEGMLAHEMAHAIIDHYLLVRPPAASAEILARYVDSHLHR